MYRIAIVSKGRAENKTQKLLDAYCIEYDIFLEPNEIEKYKAKNKISILQNDMGIVYVRNFVLDFYAVEKKYKYIVMLDDDISQFGFVIDKKCIKQNPKDVFERCFNVVEKNIKKEISLISFQYGQFAWCSKYEYKYNDFCGVVNIIKSDTDLRFDKNLIMKEDIDFTLQNIKQEKGVLKFYHLFFNTAPMTTNIGGLNQLYKDKKDEIANKQMIEKWGNLIVKEVEKHGRIDLKVNYKVV